MFVLAVTLPSNKLRAWDFFTRHLTLMDAIALIIDNELKRCEKKSNHEMKVAKAMQTFDAFAAAAEKRTNNEVCIKAFIAGIT